MYELTLRFLYDDKLQWSDALNRLVLGLVHMSRIKENVLQNFNPNVKQMVASQS